LPGGRSRPSTAQAFGINARGAVAGYYFSGSAYHGFVRAPAGAVTSFDVPGNTTGTFPQGVDDKGAVGGWYRDGKSVVHGFTWTP